MEILAIDLEFINNLIESKQLSVIDLLCLSLLSGLDTCMKCGCTRFWNHTILMTANKARGGAIILPLISGDALTAVSV